MKKIVGIILILFCMVFAVIMACSKGSEPDDNGNGNGDGEDTLDTWAPFVSFWSPSEGDTGVSVACSVYVAICDTGDSISGVNPDSIVLMVNMVGVTPTLIANSCSGFDLLYVPPTAFDYGETVAVSLEAADFAGNRLCDSIWFVIGDTADLPLPYSIDTLPPLTGFATRSRLTTPTSLYALYFSSVSPAYTELSGSSPYGVSFTSGRSFILTDSDGDIHIVNPDYSIDVLLTETPDIEKHPALAPDGYTLAFARGGSTILKNIITGVEDTLTFSANGSKELMFSPDGEYLAYRSAVSLNPTLSVWRLSDRDEIAHPLMDNDIDGLDWGPTGVEIAVITGERLYYWDVEGVAYPKCLYSAGVNLEHVIFDPNGEYVYFVDRQASGDVIKASTRSGVVHDVLDLRPESASVEAMGLSNSGDMVFAKYSASGYSLVYVDLAGGGGQEVITSSIGQTIEIAWY